MRSLSIIAIRALRTYIQTLVGLLSAAGMGADGGVLPADFMSCLLLSAQLALAPAVMSILHNVAELLSGHESSVLRG
jgi:hypothetical protein